MRDGVPLENAVVTLFDKGQTTTGVDGIASTNLTPTTKVYVPLAIVSPDGTEKGGTFLLTAGQTLDIEA